jgi:KRAB domain-containing zinc finger protein
LKPYHCQICNLSFGQGIILQKHVSSVHLNLRPFECDICQKKFASKGEVKTHVEGFHEKKKYFFCDQCCSSFLLKSALIKHFDVAHNGVKPYHCSECELKFICKASLEYHIVKNHIQPLSSSAAIVHLWNNHIKGCHEKKPYFLCHHFCSSLMRKKALIKHIDIVHNGAKPYHCSNCNLKFSYKILLESNIVKNHIQS